MTILHPHLLSARSPSLHDALEAALALVGDQEHSEPVLPVLAPPAGFTAWLIDQEPRHGPVGALAYDVIWDEQWPGDVPAPQMFDHLSGQGAIPAALAALHEAWSEWAEANETRNVA